MSSTATPKAIAQMRIEAGAPAHAPTGIAETSRIVSSQVAIESHVRSVPVVVVENKVWDVAAHRGMQMRAALEGQGLEVARINRVTSHADKEPVSENRMHVRNNRLEIIFLRKSTR